MNIEVKYPIGYQFYVPRMLERWDRETIHYPDANGVLQEYSRNVKVCEVGVKHKIVDHIEIHITDSVKTRYWCRNVDTEEMCIRDSLDRFDW